MKRCYPWSLKTLIMLVLYICTSWMDDIRERSFHAYGSYLFYIIRALFGTGSDGCGVTIAPANDPAGATLPHGTLWHNTVRTHSVAILDWPEHVRLSVAHAFEAISTCVLQGRWIRFSFVCVIAKRDSYDCLVEDLDACFDRFRLTI